MLLSRAWPATDAALDQPDRPVRGHALVARSTELAPAAGPGTVLVVAWLPAAWVPLLPNVAAVVAETGGVLSNAATLLREREIPAVFGIDGATRAIRDGEAIEVDPLRGVVRVIR